MGWAGDLVKGTLGKLPGAVIGLAGDLIGGNHSAKQSAKQAQKQMDFQERMSSTSYQRAIEDMKKAGLNPSLAYSQGGASSPSGAMGQAPDQSHIGSRSVANYATAAQVKNVEANTQNLNATTQGRLTENLIAKEKYEREKIDTDNYKAKYGVTGGRSSLDDELNILRDTSRRTRGEADTAEVSARIRRIEERILEETSGSTISSAKSTAAIREKEVTATELMNTLKRLNIPEAEAMAKWFDQVGAGSPALKAVMSIGQWLKFILNSRGTP